MSECKEQLKSFLMKVKDQSEKAGLKLKTQKPKMIAYDPITLCHIGGETMKTVTDFVFLGSKITADHDCSLEIKRCLLLGKKSMTYLGGIKKQRHYFANKGLSRLSYSFSSSHVWMWQLDHKEGWVSKNWCLWTVVLEKTLNSVLDCKEIKPVNPRGYQSWISFWRTDAEAEDPILWAPDAKSWLIIKDTDFGEDWR